ncbi:hypothetical protein EV646_111215 [Kribbella antiqua]|uniref:Uncharacterized protein n=1 Tax=Kribbella antiqua TaxID=2512217 RepID=A0A4R2IGX2_9ACTN|nr:hypothetical protein EV646_111215 [Kribbella antiqua]
MIELYGLAPEKFTQARNQFAKAAMDQGDGPAGTALKALRKPTLAAWLANQLVRVAPDGIHELTALGDDLRAAHLSADGARLRELTPHRHQLVQRLVRTAVAHANSLGRSISADVIQRLTETLDAALVDPGAAQLLRTGQLTSALRHVGFGVVDETGAPAKLAPIKPRVVRRKPPVAKPAKTKKPPITKDQPAQRRRAELRALAAEAESEYAEAAAARAAAEAELDATQHQLTDLQARIQQLTEDLNQAREQLQLARRQIPRQQRALDRATRTADNLARRRDTTRQRLTNLD